MSDPDAWEAYLPVPEPGVPLLYDDLRAVIEDAAAEQGATWDERLPSFRDGVHGWGMYFSGFRAT